MNKLSLICLFILANLTWSNTHASVKVTLNQDIYEFVNEPNLFEVLKFVKEPDNFYWPSATLYYVDADKELEGIRKLVIKKLSKLIDDYQIDNPLLALSLKQLQATITSWHLAKRLPIEINYYIAQVKSTFNPRLPHGQYVLTLPPRKNTVQVFGAIKTTNITPHQGNSDVSAYVAKQVTTSLANKDYAILLQADGRIIKTPIAYWNKGHQEVMPGSQLFIPFEESLFQPELRVINEQIITLAKNRLPK